MKMNNRNLFKKYFCGSQFFIMCNALVCILLMVYAYNDFQSPQEQVIILPQEYFGDDGTKLEIFNSETEQKEELPDKPVDKNKVSSQKDSNQQKQQKVPDKPDLKVPGMNTTHINGILMEPVHVNYTRNIYFTIKTTHRYYTNRLFPIMLTWLQSVDKNKVSYYNITKLLHHRRAGLYQGFEIGLG